MADFSTDSPQGRRWRNLRDRFLRSHTLVQAGQTPAEVIHQDALGQVLHYAADPAAPVQHRVPVVLVAPLAVNTMIYDLFPDRSLVRYLSAQGFCVYLIDWGRPGRRQTGQDFEHYVVKALPVLLARVRAHSGQAEISLHGWSMAGVFVLLYVAYHRDDQVRNVVIQGTPVDAHRSGPLGRMFASLQQALNRLEARTGLHPRRLPVAWLHTPGVVNSLTFKLLNPLGHVRNHLSMLQHSHERSVVEAHATMAAFLNDMVDYPGGINHDMVLRVWLDNGLGQGRFALAGREVHLSVIHAALLAVAGSSDELVTREAMAPLLALVGSVDKKLVMAPGGHMGMLAGTQAAKTHWPVLADWLAQRSN